MATESPLRKVGTFTAACVLVSNAVGSGIFTTTGFMARDLGDPTWILLLWAAGGALALAGAMSYSELGASLPRVGGEYVYLRRAFGPLCGFLSGWMSFTIGFSAAIAAVSVGFGAYLLTLLPDSMAEASPTPIAPRSTQLESSAVEAFSAGSPSRRSAVSVCCWRVAWPSGRGTGRIWARAPRLPGRESARPRSP